MDKKVLYGIIAGVLSFALIAACNSGEDTDNSDMNDDMHNNEEPQNNARDINTKDDRHGGAEVPDVSPEDVINKKVGQNHDPNP